MIKIVEDRKELNLFIYFVKKLYENDARFVCPIFSALKKELRREVLEKKNYTAILCERDGEIVGRLMYTLDKSRSKGETICFFSFFDAINDKEVAKELFEYMKEDVRKDGITYLEGTFSPYDPDTRRGVLVKGFDKPHTLFTSYNFEYYQALLEHCGFTKAYDTYTMEAPVDEKNHRLTDLITRRVLRSFDVRTDSLNFKLLERDVTDVMTILKEATTELNYQEVQSSSVIWDVVKSMKPFIDADLIKIARENKTNKPIGFVLVLKDFNQIFARSKGKLDIFKFFKYRNKITSARGLLQYVVPEYQNTGVTYLLYGAILDEFQRKGITTFEGGTMMEDNRKAWTQFEKFGGSISKIYRIFGQNI